MQTYIHSKWCCLDARETSSTSFTFVLLTGAESFPIGCRSFYGQLTVWCNAGNLVSTVTNQCNKIPWNTSFPTMVFHVLMPLTSSKNESFPTTTWVEITTTNISILPRKNRTASLPLKAMMGSRPRRIFAFPSFWIHRFFWGCGSALLYFASQQRCLGCFCRSFLWWKIPKKTSVKWEMWSVTISGSRTSWNHDAFYWAWPSRDFIDLERYPKII